MLFTSSSSGFLFVDDRCPSKTFGWKRFLKLHLPLKQQGIYLWAGMLLFACCVCVMILPAPQGEIRPCPARCWSSVWAWLNGNSRVDWSNTGLQTEKPVGRSDTSAHLDRKRETHLAKSSNSHTMEKVKLQSNTLAKVDATDNKNRWCFQCLAQ